MFANKSCVYINDGDIADSSIVDQFMLKEFCQNGKYNFVGFINRPCGVICSFPKHFLYNNCNISDDIKLLVQCIIKGAKSALGYNDVLDTNIPFKEYINILSYYYRNGIHSRNLNVCKNGYKGRINWNNTFKKSNKILDNGNLLFLPLQINKNERLVTFIGYAMSYVLNDAYEQFGKFINLGEPNFLHYRSNFFFNNPKIIINLLKKELDFIFNDVDIQLIQNLILYFEWKGSLKEDMFFITQSFNVLWENMVHKFLCENFSGYDAISNRILFSCRCKKYDFKKVIEFVESSNIPIKNHNFSVEYDHIYREDNHIYLFDSKYYSQVNELNYKQVAYHYFLANNVSHNNVSPLNIVNGLIFPTSNQYYSNVHVDRRNIDGVYISEHYLNIRELMDFYLV